MTNNNNPRVINDPVHGSIELDPNDKLIDKVLIDLIDTPEFQRLRRVRQLGFGFLTYPGAEHSRFGHCLGTMELARRIVKQVQKYDDDIPMDGILLVVVSALLHDIGHGPFSHTSEPSFDPQGNFPHENWSAAIVQDPTTGVHKVLTARDPSLPEKVANVIVSNGEFLAATLEDYAYLANIVSSQLDADRFDYLLRDAYFSGVTYGRFDVNWLIRNIRPDRTFVKGGQLIVSYKGKHTLEQYLYARYYMHHTVYFHKATRAAEIVYKKLIMRAQYLHANDPDALPESHGLVADALAGPINSTTTSCADYLATDDSTMYSTFKEWAESSDEVLSDLANRLLNRNLLKSIELPQKNGTISYKDIAKIQGEVSNMLESNGIDPNYYFELDDPSQYGYKTIYSIDDQESSKTIMVESGPGEKPAEASDLLPSIHALKGNVGHLRINVPERFKQETVEIVKGVLG